MGTAFAPRRHRNPRPTSSSPASPYVNQGSRWSARLVPCSLEPLCGARSSPNGTTGTSPARPADPVSIDRGCDGAVGAHRQGVADGIHGAVARISDGVDHRHRARLQGHRQRPEDRVARGPRGQQRDLVRAGGHVGVGVLAVGDVGEDDLAVDADIRRSDRRGVGQEHPSLLRPDRRHAACDRCSPPGPRPRRPAGGARRRCSIRTSPSSRVVTLPEPGTPVNTRSCAPAVSGTGSDRDPTSALCSTDLPSMETATSAPGTAWTTTTWPGPGAAPAGLVPAAVRVTDARTTPAKNSTILTAPPGERTDVRRVRTPRIDRSTAGSDRQEIWSPAWGEATRNAREIGLAD